MLFFLCLQIDKACLALTRSAQLFFEEVEFAIMACSSNKSLARSRLDFIDRAVVVENMLAKRQADQSPKGKGDGCAPDQKQDTEKGSAVAVPGLGAERDQQQA